jgi:putative FmdB family regulatory protein
MPIYEYKCADCLKECELLVRSSTVIQCPHCGSKRLEKHLSAFSQGSPALTTTYVPPGSPGHPDN